MYNIFDDPFFKDPIFFKKKSNNDNDNMNEFKCEKRFYVNGKEVSEEEYKSALNPTPKSTTTQDVDVKELENKLKALRKKIEDEKQPVKKEEDQSLIAETPFIIFSSDPVDPVKEEMIDGGKLCTCGDDKCDDAKCECECKCENEPVSDEEFESVNSVQKIAEGVVKVSDMPIFYLNHYVGQNKMRDEVYLPFTAIDKDGFSISGITDSQILALLAYRFRKSDKLSAAMANLIKVFYDEIK